MEIYTFISSYPYWFGFIIAINFFAFALYGFDKFFSILKYWRVRERTLLLIALFGGTIGAWIGVFLFRHKTRKDIFLLLLALITLLQVAALLTWKALFPLP